MRHSSEPKVNLGGAQIFFSELISELRHEHVLNTVPVDRSKILKQFILDYSHTLRDKCERLLLHETVVQIRRGAYVVRSECRQVQKSALDCLFVGLVEDLLVEALHRHEFLDVFGLPGPLIPLV